MTVRFAVLTDIHSALIIGAYHRVISKQGLSALAMLFVIATTVVTLISSALRRAKGGDPDV